MASRRQKVLIYAVSARGLLVFDEPEFPDVPLQVPGGTVEPGEEVPTAAAREFTEETGLAGVPYHLVTAPYSYSRDGQDHVLERSYFLVSLGGELPAEWTHVEETPSDGSAPVLFRLHWIGLDQAAAALGLGMGDYVHLIPHRP